MQVDRFTRRQWVLLVTPVVLVPAMVLVFRGLVAEYGLQLGYLLAFAVYWVGWCLVLPAALLGVDGIRDVFREGTPRFGDRPRLVAALLLWPLPFPLFTYFLPNVGEATLAVLVVSVLVGVTIGVTEELLWRGTFVRVFPENVWLGYVYPTVTFALWHVAPLSVRPPAVPGGAYAFVFYSLLLGGSYGYYARKTGSIRWCTVSHVVHDSLGLSGFTFLLLTNALG